MVPLVYVFFSKQPAKLPLACGDSDIQPKIALVLAKCCLPFRTVQISLLELIFNTKMFFCRKGNDLQNPLF